MSFQSKEQEQLLLKDIANGVGKLVVGLVHDSDNYVGKTTIPDGTLVPLFFGLIACYCTQEYAREMSSMDLDMDDHYEEYMNQLRGFFIKGASNV